MNTSKTTFTKTATKSNDKKSANGFINLSVTDSEGNVHKLRAGSALYEDNNLENSILIAAKEAAAQGKEFSLNITGTVNVIVPESEKKAINF